MHREGSSATKPGSCHRLRLQLARASEQPFEIGVQLGYRGRVEQCSRRELGVGRPYDLRHSFASLLLAEGRSIHYVACRLGHSPALTLSTYGHLFAEYEHADRIDAAAEIAQAREALGVEFTRRVPTAQGRRHRRPRRHAS
jgi:integrase